jgi:HSP20 family protein
MQVQRFDPFTVLARMDREFDELVRRGWVAKGGGARGDGSPSEGRAGEGRAGEGRAGEGRLVAAGFVPAVEVTRDGEDVVVRVELPGIDVDRDVAIEVERGKLVISGERRDTRADSPDGVLVRELRYGQFRREFALPAGISPEQVEANYDAGLLDVRVRGVVAPEPTPVRVPITTAGPRAVEPTAPAADEADPS